MDFDGADIVKGGGLALFAYSVWFAINLLRREMREDLSKIESTLSAMTERLARIDDRTFRSEAIPEIVGEEKTKRSKTQTPFTPRGGKGI